MSMPPAARTISSYQTLPNGVPSSTAVMTATLLLASCQVLFELRLQLTAKETQLSTTHASHFHTNSSLSGSDIENH